MSDILKHAACPACDQPAGKPCRTNTGKSTYPHVARGVAFRNRRRTGEHIIELLHDDAHAGLRTGDRLLVAEEYRGARLKVLRRIPDGFSPGCIIYRANTIFISFSADLEAP